MRQMISFVLPALIFIALVYVVGRKRGAAGADRDGDSPVISNTTFVLCLVVGAGFTVALLFGIAAL